MKPVFLSCLLKNCLEQRRTRYSDENKANRKKRERKNIKQPYAELKKSKKLWRFLLSKKLWRFLHSIEPSSSPPPPHPQPPNLFIFDLVGFLRVDGRGFCWQISSDPHYIWLLHRSQYTLLRAI